MNNDLDVRIYTSRDEMGKNAALQISNCIRSLLLEKPYINMIFAAAPSQNEMLHYLCLEDGIEWNRINAFHMDEYIGLPSDAPQGFGNFLKRHIFDKKPFKSVNIMRSDLDISNAQAECTRYALLLKEHPCDIVCMGIGENGHIAFNDPHVADFCDPETVKVVTLDTVCRMQQVNDGCFEKIEDVPQYAMTVTIPALMSARYRFCVVPGNTKAQAVYNTINSSVSECCPASILRQYENSILYCDKDSSSLLKKATVY